MNHESPSITEENAPLRLILVSNRLPVQLVKKNGEVTIKQSDGGLVTALKNYFEQESTKDAFEQKVWVGAADFSEKRWAKMQQPCQEFKIEPLFIDPKIYNKQKLKKTHLLGLSSFRIACRCNWLKKTARWQ